MKLCWQKASATQFAIYMAGANIGMALGAFTYAALVNVLTANQIFLLLGGVFFGGALLAWRTNFEKHYEQMNTLDNTEVESFVPYNKFLSYLRKFVSRS